MPEAFTCQELCPLFSSPNRLKDFDRHPAPALVLLANMRAVAGAPNSLTRLAILPRRVDWRSLLKLRGRLTDIYSQARLTIIGRGVSWRSHSPISIGRVPTFCSSASFHSPLTFSIELQCCRAGRHPRHSRKVSPGLRNSSTWNLTIDPRDMQSVAGRSGYDTCLMEMHCDRLSLNPN